MKISRIPILTAAVATAVVLSFSSALAQDLCKSKGDGHISTPNPNLGCFPNLLVDPYYTSQGWEIYGVSRRGDSAVSALTPRINLAAGRTQSLNDGATYYKSLTVAAGATLTVPSGTVLRVRDGECNIAGTIVVSGASKGGQRPDTWSVFASEHGSAPAHPGISSRSAGFGSVGQSVESIYGGAGGIGLEIEQAKQVRYPGLYGGGGGAAGATEIGGAGGGTFVLLCEGRTRISGQIIADGVSAFGAGGGGGAGGVIVIGSDSPITLTATSLLRAKGGDGGPASTYTGPGGGGGGGIIHLVSPTVTRNGSTNVAGGAGLAAGSGSVQNQLRTGGGGGGACGGNGGDGGTVNSDLSHTASESGSAGHLIVTRAVPRFIFG
jgi:hypothetical protein